MGDRRSTRPELPEVEVAVEVVVMRAEGRLNRRTNSRHRAVWVVVEGEEACGCPVQAFGKKRPITINLTQTPLNYKVPPL